MNKTMHGEQENCHSFNRIWSCGDMEISYQDFQTMDDCFLWSGSFEKKMITFMFYLAGESKLTIMENGQSKEYRFLPDTFGAHYNPRCEYCIEYPSCKRVQILRIVFCYQVFLDLLAESKTAVGYQKLSKDADIFNRFGPISPAMQLIVSQILDPLLYGDAQNFFFTARVMDLINCLLNEQDKEAFSSSPLDQECTRKAQAILESNLENPPSISELAQRVGVSPAKLKHIFPKVCGMPPYCYLRKLRMENALRLLNSGEMNVTETSYEVGYNSISHFSNVFAKYFGMKPSEARNMSRIKNLSDN